MGSEAVTVGIVERVDEFLKRNLMGVYLALNTKSRIKYGKPFANLLLNDPGKALELLSEYVMGNEDAAEFIVRAALSAVISDNEELSKLVKLLREGMFEEFRRELMRIVNEVSA